MSLCDTAKLLLHYLVLQLFVPSVMKHSKYYSVIEGLLIARTKIPDSKCRPVGQNSISNATHIQT